MTPVLCYEVPAHSEWAFQPTGVRRLLAILVAVLIAAGTVLPLLFHRWMGAHALLLTIGPTIGVATVVLCAAVYGHVQVFADRLELALLWAGVRVWRRRVVWPDVTAVRTVRRRPGEVGYQVFQRGPGLTVVLFGGDGVSAHVRDQAELLIGSADPARLAAAIDAARAGDR